MITSVKTRNAHRSPKHLTFSPPPTGGGFLGFILNTCESNQMFNSQLINNTKILLLTNVAFMVSKLPYRLLNSFHGNVDICYYFSHF